MQGLITSVASQVCAAYRLLVAWELDRDGSGLNVPMFLKPTDHLEQLSQHLGDVIPQPAHISQITSM